MNKKKIQFFTMLAVTHLIVAFQFFAAVGIVCQDQINWLLFGGLIMSLSFNYYAYTGLACCYVMLYIDIPIDEEIEEIINKHERK